MHEGVIRDVERQQRRRAENLYQLQQQLELAKEIKKRDEFEQFNQRLTASGNSAWSLVMLYIIIV